MSHTLGPLKYLRPTEPDDWDRDGQIVHVNGERIGYACGIGSCDERDANGILWAAAPDLLAACKAAVHMLQNAAFPHASNASELINKRDGIVQDMMDAIAKAEGDS